MNKSVLRDQILAQLHRELATQTSAAQSARDEAISEESKPENQYDMHSQEAAYLAEGQARLAAEIQASIAFYQALSLSAFGRDTPIAIGALVEIQANNRKTQYFIGPRAGGLEVPFHGQAVLVLTPQSPLGRELLGKREGETIHISTRTGREAHRIVAVR